MAGRLRRILVVEDDPETAGQLVESLVTNGYEVDLAINGNDGLARGRAAEYAVMTIDRMLPGADGLAIIRRLRESGVGTPALIISALGEVDDRVRGLRAGGDDYLVKPFSFAEMLARVDALARRSATVVKETVLRVSDLTLDLVARTANRGGRDIELLPREFKVLEYLVRNQGHIVPRAMLLQHVWDLHFDPTTNIIDVYVGRVRRKVDGKGPNPLVHTIRESGIACVLLTKTLRSSTLRLALICIGVFGTVVCALFTYVYWSTAAYVRSRSDHAITEERAVLHRAFERAGRDGVVVRIAMRVADERFEGGVYLLADAGFKPVAGNLTVWPAALRSPEGWANFDAPDWRPDARERPLLRAAFETLPDGSHLLVGREIEDLDTFAGQIETALTLSVLFTFLLAGLASVFVTRRTMTRIEAINATSRAIMKSGLGQRIPHKGTSDEWDQLAQNLNLMLDRIESLMVEVKEVSDNVAHDLRTPLAHMRGRLEKACARPRDATRDQSLIGDTMADLDAVLRMFASLTRIAQVEASDRTAAFRPVDLAHLAHEVAELFDAAAEEKGGRLSVMADQPALVNGDRDLLFDAVANLIDNAIKHGRDAGQVTVQVAKEAQGAPVIAVTDDGPGIPVNESHLVFKRFYRLERSRRTPGNGLGLSLVAAVARLHGARVELSDNAPGLRVRFAFAPPGEDGEDRPGAQAA